MHSQFYQLWTVFDPFGCHILSIANCELSAIHEELYSAVLAKFHELVPQFEAVRWYLPTRLLHSTHTKYLEKDAKTWPFQYLSSRSRFYNFDQGIHVSAISSVGSQNFEVQICVDNGHKFATVNKFKK